MVLTQNFTRVFGEKGGVDEQLCNLLTCRRSELWKKNWLLISSKLFTLSFISSKIRINFLNMARTFELAKGYSLWQAEVVSKHLWVIWRAEPSNRIPSR